MALRYRLERKVETLQDFELAADRNYWAALELLVSGHETAGLYLLGYVAEMLLKNACCRTEGANPVDLVGPYMAPARRWMAKYYPMVEFESFHKLVLDPTASA